MRFSTLNYGLKLYIIDPAGVNVTNKIHDDAINKGMPREKFVIGASTRMLNETFGGYVAEHGKVMRFFR